MMFFLKEKRGEKMQEQNNAISFFEEMYKGEIHFPDAEFKGLGEVCMCGYNGG